jgi:hypothetical protein
MLQAPREQERLRGVDLNTRQAVENILIREREIAPFKIECQIKGVYFNANEN